MKHKLNIEVGQIWIFKETKLPSKIIEVVESENELEIKFEYENSYYIVDEDYLRNTHKLKLNG